MRWVGFLFLVIMVCNELVGIVCAQQVQSPPSTVFAPFDIEMLRTAPATTTSRQEILNGDRPLNYGAILDHTCFERLPLQRAQALEASLNRALSRLRVQTQRCSQQFGFPGTAGIETYFPGIRFSCEYLSPHIDMSTSDLLPLRGGALLRTGSSIGEFNIQINISNQFERTDVNYAVAIFHELLHHGAMNQNARHDEANLPNTCEETKFRDVIFFLEAVCFPGSTTGSQYLRGFQAIHERCPNLCREVLTQPPSFEDSLWTRILLVGPPRRFRPVSAEQARVSCERFDQNFETRLSMEVRFIHFISSTTSRRDYFLDSDFFAPKHHTQNLIDIFSEASGDIQGLGPSFGRWHRSSIISAMDRLRDKIELFQRSSLQLCSQRILSDPPEPLTSLVEFCQNRRRPLIEEMQRWLIQLQEFDRSDMEIFED